MNHGFFDRSFVSLVYVCSTKRPRGGVDRRLLGSRRSVIIFRNSRRLTSNLG
jgi:hypothetical protein